MANDCCSAASERMVVACSGASNLGQIANSVVVKMQQQGTGQMSCLAALGAQVPSYIESAKGADLVVIDGCPVACAKKVADQIGVSGYKYFDLSQMLPGVQKAKRYNQVEEHASLAYDLVLDEL
ncbi:MAG: putative zinc-binding protein [Solirubrobacterales bacterium]